jgi:hypothetical protein
MHHDLKLWAARMRALAIPFETKTSCPADIWLAVLLGAISILLSTTAAQAGTLTGTVLDPTGRPIPQANVTLVKSLVVLDQHQADGKGDFKFIDLADGKYKLSASAPGLASPQVEVDVRGAASQTLDLHLQLSAVQWPFPAKTSSWRDLNTTVNKSKTLTSRIPMACVLCFPAPV